MFPKSSGGENLRIKSIVGCKRSSNGQRYFEIEWENSWECEEAVQHMSPDLLARFLSGAARASQASRSEDEKANGREATAEAQSAKVSITSPDLQGRSLSKKESNLKALDDIFAPGSDESEEETDSNGQLKIDFMKPKPRVAGGINDIVSRLQKGRIPGNSRTEDASSQIFSEPAIAEDAPGNEQAIAPEQAKGRPPSSVEKPLSHVRGPHHPPENDGYHESRRQGRLEYRELSRRDAADYPLTRTHIPKDFSSRELIVRDRSRSPSLKRTRNNYMHSDLFASEISYMEHFPREHAARDRKGQYDSRDSCSSRSDAYDSLDSYERHDSYRRRELPEPLDRHEHIRVKDPYVRDNYQSFEEYKPNLSLSSPPSMEVSETAYVPQSSTCAGSLSPRSQISPPLPSHGGLHGRSSTSSLKSLKSNVDNIGRLFPDDAALNLQGRLDGAYYENHGKDGGPLLASQFQPSVILKCSICSDVFYEDVKFKQHMDMHEQVNLLKREPPKLLKPGTFECKFCRAILDDKDKLKAHYTEDHEQEYVNTQPMDQLYQCSLCDKTFVDYNKLVQHHQSHQSGRREVYILPKKGILEPASPLFMAGVHISPHTHVHPDPRSQSQSESMMPSSPFAPSTPAFASSSQVSALGPVGRSTTYYPASSRSPGYLYLSHPSPPLEDIPGGKPSAKNDSPSVHVSLESPKSRTSSPNGSLSESEPASMTTLDFKPVNDALLNKKISADSVADGNAGAVSPVGDNKKSYRCNLCDELFISLEERATHALLHMNRSNSLSCHICGKQFRHRTNLTTHLIVHSGVKPHQCHICSRRFTQKVNLQRHMHIHDGSRPFSCGMCNKSFTQKANLQRHILSHTEHTNEDLVAALNKIPNESAVNNAVNESLNDVVPKNPSPLPAETLSEVRVSDFRCEICDKTFAQKVNLQKHMMIHSGQRPFQCYVCGKSFRQKATLQKHYTIHTHGSTSFNCQTCQRLFMSKTNLQRHMLVHALPGSTQCYLCDQKFSTSDNLERHFSEHIEEASPATSLPQNHLDQGHPGQSFRCATCDIVFESAAVFTKHLQCHSKGFAPGSASQSEDGTSPCEEDKSFSLQCNVCSQMFSSAEKLDKHILSHRRDSGSRRSPRNSDFQVDLEDTGLRRDRPRSNASSGLSAVSEAVKSEESEIAPGVKRESSPPAMRSSRCPVCKEKFPSKHEMRVHFTSVHMDSPKPSEGTRRASESLAEPPEVPSVASVEDLACLPNENSAVVSEDEERLIRENEEFIKDNILGGCEEYESKGRYERGNYSCKICNRVLTYKYSLEKHMLLHTGSFPYKCSLCSKRFNHKANLDKHMVVHSGVKPYVCHICGRPFSQKSNLQRHQLTHTQNRDFICEICGKRFNHMASLKTHSLIHTGAKPFSCYICTKRFNQKGNLKRHIQTHKTGKRNRVTNLARDHAGMDDQAIEKYHEQMGEDQMRLLLDDFDVSKVSKVADVSAKRSKKKRKVRRSDFDFSDEPLPTMISDEFEKIQDENTRELESGEILPPGKDLQEDGILTVLPSDLGEESKVSNDPSASAGSEPFKCDLCGKLFISSTSLDFHRRSLHSEILCDICGKHFSQKANLLKHKLIHANKKPFSCKVCFKAFRQKANLQRHELIHDKERKAVNCEKCGKTFRCNWSLKQHMKSHSQNRPFGCSICGKTFKQRAILKRHFLVHSGLRSFSCKICGKAFNHKGNLLRHMAIHDDVPDRVLEKALGLGSPRTDGGEHPERDTVSEKSLLGKGRSSKNNAFKN